MRGKQRRLGLVLVASLVVLLAGALAGTSAADAGTVTGSKKLDQMAIDCDGEVDVTISLTGAVSPAKIVLAIDRSSSMASSIAAVKTGMDQLIDGVLLGNGSTVGVVTFGDPASVAQGLTDSKTSAKAAVPTTTGGSTNVADAISKSQTMLGGDGRRILVLVGDGFATRPSNPFTAATTAANTAKAAGIQIVTLGVPDTAGNINANLATWATPGSSYTASPASTIGTAVGAIVNAIATAATNVQVVDTLSADFSVSGVPLPTKGTASISNGAVTWSLAALGHETVSLTYTAQHVGTLGDLKQVSTVSYSDDQERDADDVGLANPSVFVSCSPADKIDDCTGGNCTTNGSLPDKGLDITSAASGVPSSSFLVQRSLGSTLAPCAGFTSLIGAPGVEIYTTNQIPDVLTIRFVISKETRKKFKIGIGHLRVCLETNLPFKMDNGKISPASPGGYAGLLPKKATKTDVPGYGSIASPYFTANGAAVGQAEVVVYVRKPYDPRPWCC
jgi:hypothetical protein